MAHNYFDVRKAPSVIEVDLWVWTVTSSILYPAWPWGWILALVVQKSDISKL